MNKYYATVTGARYAFLEYISPCLKKGSHERDKIRLRVCLKYEGEETTSKIQIDQLKVF